MATDPGVILAAGRGLTPIQSPLEAQQEALKLRMMQQTIQSNQVLEQDRTLLAAQRVRQQAGNEALAASIKKHSTTDPNGEDPVDYHAVAQDLEAAGFPELANHYLKSQNENAEALGKIWETTRQHAKEKAAAIGDLAYGAQSIEDFTARVGMAATYGLLGQTPEENEQVARQVVGHVQAAGPDGWQAVKNHFQQLSPRFQADQNPKTVAEIGRLGAQTEEAQATTAKIKAEIAGKLPKTPAQQETERHNLEEERIATLRIGREAAAAVETARHNRATEAAANPLAALTGPQGAPGGVGPAGAPTAAPAPAMLTGDAFLKTLPGNVATEVKAYAEGRRPFPAGFALKSPYFQSLIQMVGQYDPTFDAVNYNARAKTRQDFTSGKSAQTINALNTVAQHLDRLSQSADKLNNSWSPMYNSVANFLSRHTGKPVVTNFETDKKAVVDELTRTWRQAGGSEGDIKSWSAVLDAANSPSQLHGAIGEMGQLIEGKLSALEAQAQQGLGTAHDIQVVKPEARSVLSRLEQKASNPALVAPVPDTVQKALTGQKPGRYTLSDGSVWMVDANGIRKAP